MKKQNYAQIIIWAFYTIGAAICVVGKESSKPSEKIELVIGSGIIALTCIWQLYKDTYKSDVNKLQPRVHKEKQPLSQPGFISLNLDINSEHVLNQSLSDSFYARSFSVSETSKKEIAAESHRFFSFARPLKSCEDLNEKNPIMIAPSLERSSK
jgi:hypothetical protein